MNKATLRALNGSIKKWQKIVDGEGFDEKSDNCPLCQRFLKKNGNCYGCPVYEKVLDDMCCGTPYDKWHDRLPKTTKGYDFKGHGDAKRAARAELKFLQSLLPKKD